MPDAVDRAAITLQLTSKRDTQKLGRVLAAILAPGDLLVLEGSLGAGKTFLVQCIARSLGVPATQPVTSPTFAILHEFAGRVPIVHADLYRLDLTESLSELGLLAHIAGDAVVLVEWGERFAEQLGDSGLRVSLELGVGNTRSCVLEARAARGRALMARAFPLLSAASLATGRGFGLR
jgi:tRNA threonylcarbamoyladenosine biosynthesis protein TsaE